MQNCATVIPCISRHFFYFESMPTIGSIEPYDGVENFKQYMQRVNFYFTANNVGSEFASTAGLGSSTVDQVLKYTKYLKYIPSTSTGQVLIFLKST